MNSKFQQHGLVLLEGLIAILIFSMAIMAVVGLQATAIAKSTEAQYRADAAFLANQLLAQMMVHAGSGVITAAGIQPGNAMASGVAAAPNLYNYHCPNCTIAAATAAGTKAGDPEYVRWLQQIQGTAGQAAFLPGVTDTMNMPSINVHCTSADLALMPTCSAATMPQSATEVTITLRWQKSTRAGSPQHTYETSSDIQPN